MDPRIEEAQELVTSLQTKCQLRKEKLLRKERKSNGNQNNNSLANNNDASFKNQYATTKGHDHRSSSGRLSSNSASGSAHESAFSSSSAASSSEGEESEDLANCEHPSLSSADSSSGRSSANEQTVDPSSQDEHRPASQAKQLNSVCNLAPTNNQLARQLVEEVRCKFLDSLKSQSDSSDKYEQADLDELKSELAKELHGHEEQALSFRLISRFINFKVLMEMESKNKQDNNSEALDKALDEATAKLRDLLLFRRQYKLSAVMDDHFCKEMHMLHGIFPFGHDKNHLPVLYLRARVHRRWSRELDESFRRYVAWQVNLLTKSYPDAQVSKTIGTNGIEKDGSFGICFDCLSVSYSCVDMDFLSYLVKILVNYYPTYCRYALCVDLPWLFRSVWKMVRSWLPEDARNTVQLITSKQLTEFIDEDQIPNSIRINDLTANEKPDSLKHRLPDNFDQIRTIEQIAKDLNLSTSEVKQFKAHVEKVRKEYQQLGAI